MEQGDNTRAERSISNGCSSRLSDRRDSLDELAETSEIGNWKMPDFKAASAYAVSQGWLIVRDDVLTLTVAGLAAA